MSKHEVLTCMKLGCTAYDELAEKNKALTERIAAMRRIDSETRDQAARDYAKVKSLTAEKKTLTAENKRLRGQTDCETKSGGILCIEQEDKILALTERIAEWAEIIDYDIRIGPDSHTELRKVLVEMQALKGGE